MNGYGLIQVPPLTRRRFLQVASANAATVVLMKADRRRAEPGDLGLLTTVGEARRSLTIRMEIGSLPPAGAHLVMLAFPSTGNSSHT